MKIIAMIPARMGSKRIPKKNIRIMDGKPLIRHAIDVALDSDEFESIWVNSEEEKLGLIANEAGVGFHKRPVDLATDSATNREFTYEFLEAHPCDYVVMVNTTSPLLRAETVKRFCKMVKTGEYDTIMATVSEKAETFYQGQPLNFDTAEKVNSQVLPPVDKVVWALTAWKRELFMKMEESGQCAVYGGKMGTFAIPQDESCDLDTEEEWRIAEGIMESRKADRTPSYYDL